MIRKAAQMRTEVRRAMRGGAGEVVIQHLFEKDEIKARTRLCARLTVPPGAGIGLHPHEGEDELFVVTRGRGVIDDGAAQTPVEAGDAILTGNGESHAVRNDGAEPLEILALILLY